jgi:hypothetical protein
MVRSRPIGRGCAVASLVLVAAGAAHGQFLARWNVSAYTPANNGGAVTPLALDFAAPNVIATAVTAGPGVQSLDPCGGGLALTACAGAADMWVQYFSVPFDPADYFQWSVTPAPGYQITYTNFQVPMGILYIVDRTVPNAPRSTGPKTWELRYSLDNFATPGTTLMVGDPFPLSIQGIPGMSVGASEEVHIGGSIAAIGTQAGTVTFRFYGYNIENAHPSGPLGFGAGPTNRTYFGFARFDLGVSGTVTQGACYANCDASTATPVLNVADFTCFLQRFAAGDAYANCDGSTAIPVLNVADFTCFLQRFAAGCT